MKKQVLFGLWAGLFIVCAALGFIPEPQGGVRAVMTLSALAFFVPPALLLREGHRSWDRPLLQLVRNLAAASLVLTALLLMGNFLSVLGSEELGRFLHSVLTVVSSPMLCSGSWAMSLFCWACVLLVALKLLKKK